MSYVDQVLAKLKEKNANEPEFLQAAEEVLTSLKPVIEANDERIVRDSFLEQLTEPDRQFKFKVTWVDDSG